MPDIQVSDMPAEPPSPWLADLVLILHVLVVIFVVGGLVLVLTGNVLRWRWVNARRFRFLHIAAVMVIVAESWIGLVCPLTSLENWLRARAGDPGYGNGFVAHWLQELLYYEAPGWVFTLAYSLFALLVGLAWWYFPPAARQGDVE